MKKIHSRKLSLQRETLTDLTPDSLEGVAGGVKLPKWTDLKQPIGTCFCPRNTVACMPGNLSISKPYQFTAKPTGPLTNTAR